MPPKKSKNKPSKNGFWQFVMETRDKSTHKHMSMQELQNYAGQKWANMSKEERKPYEDMAMLARDTYRPTKMTTDGLEIEEVQRQKKEAENKQRSMKNNISTFLKTCSLAETLADQIFLIIHINHLIYYPADDRYFICELAISAFSLKNGVEDVYHSIVKPGKLPLGYYGGSLAHSKETHQLIEIVQEEPYEDNTQHVFHEVIRFMRKFSEDRKLPILYADEKTFEMTTKVFETFRDDFQFADDIKVYNLQYMFFALRNAAAGRNVWPTETFSYSEIEKDVYSYCPNISCDYHELSDISVYCSKSIVTRYSYTICDNCCADLFIQLKPGCHVPEKAKIQSIALNSNSASVTSIDQINNSSRRESLSSRGYEENYPPLGSSRSSVSSLISFSSMVSPKARNISSTSRNLTGAEEPFQKVSLGRSAKRDHANLKFPEHGFKKRDN